MKVGVGWEGGGGKGVGVGPSGFTITSASGIFP